MLGQAFVSFRSIVLFAHSSMRTRSRECVCVFSFLFSCRLSVCLSLLMSLTLHHTICHAVSLDRNVNLSSTQFIYAVDASSQIWNFTGLQITHTHPRKKKNTQRRWKMNCEWTSECVFASASTWHFHGLCISKSHKEVCLPACLPAYVRQTSNAH